MKMKVGSKPSGAQLRSLPMVAWRESHWLRYRLLSSSWCVFHSGSTLTAETRRVSRSPVLESRKPDEVGGGAKCCWTAEQLFVTGVVTNITAPAEVDQRACRVSGISGGENTALGTAGCRLASVWLAPCVDSGGEENTCSCSDRETLQTCMLDGPQAQSKHNIHFLYYRWCCYCQKTTSNMKSYFIEITNIWSTQKHSIEIDLNAPGASSAHTLCILGTMWSNDGAMWKWIFSHVKGLEWSQHVLELLTRLRKWSHVKSVRQNIISRWQKKSNFELHFCVAECRSTELLPPRNVPNKYTFTHCIIYSATPNVDMRGLHYTSPTLTCKSSLLHFLPDFFFF